MPLWDQAQQRRRGEASNGTHRVPSGPTLCSESCMDFTLPGATVISTPHLMYGAELEPPFELFKVPYYSPALQVYKPPAILDSASAQSYIRFRLNSTRTMSIIPILSTILSGVELTAKIGEVRPSQLPPSPDPAHHTHIFIDALFNI